VANSSELGRSLVVAEEGEWTFAVEIQRSLQSGKQRQKCLSKASDGSALVGDEVSASSEQKLQFGDLLLTWLKSTEVRPHPSLIGDEADITSILLLHFLCPRQRQTRREAGAQSLRASS
jgi:hypothetical protein